MEEHTDLWRAFSDWQTRCRTGWGLAWLLAAQVCERFYASHGIVPHVIEHEGLGYYGIAVVQLACQVNAGSKLGRFTKAGNVENWVTESPGDHGLKLESRAAAGEAVGPMVAEAVQYLRLPPFPHKSHLGCKHKRWGASYELVFRLSALLALRWNERVRIWNDPYHTAELAVALDPQAGKGEPPGHFLWVASERRMFVAGDGRVLEPTGWGSLWQRYMEGTTPGRLLADVEDALGLRAEA